MPRVTLAGHPLHPQLISAPAALLPASFALDAMYMATGRKSYADAAYYTMLGGYLGGLAAAAAGAGDYASIPQESETKKHANMHAALNAAVMAMYSLNLLHRRGREEVGALAFLLSALGTAGIAVSAWYGGHMVYVHGMRVQGRDEVSGARELKLPADECIEHAFVTFEERLATQIAEAPGIEKAAAGDGRGSRRRRAE